MLFGALKTFARSLYSPAFRAGMREGRRIRREFDTAVRIVRARYDAAQLNDHNSAHWSMADARSARAALNPGVRKRIRQNSRYEIDNNSWLSGMVDTLADHTIGTGPRLLILHPNIAACLRVQAAWTKWAKKAQFCEKLHTLKTAWGRDGDVLALKIQNKKLWPFQFDFRLIETDQCSNPYMSYVDPWIDDGIQLDKNGIPEAYFILHHHPGDPRLFNGFGTQMGEWHDASDVLHYFHAKRPGQVRGVAPLAASLELAPILRRTTRAAIKSCETAASHASVIKTTASGVEVAASPQDFAAVEFEHGMQTILPEGWEIQQLESVHPNSNYEMMVKWIVNEIARPFSMPLNIALCNSSGYNYSSGQLDHLTYHKAIEIDQALIETKILDSLFESWWNDARFAVKGIDEGLPDLDELQWQWCWDARPVIDESTDASASTERLKSGQSTLPLEWQKRGWGDVEAQLQKGADSLGVTVEEYQQLIQFQLFGMTASQLAVATHSPITLPDGTTQASTSDGVDVPSAENPSAVSASSPSLGVSTGVRLRDVANNQKAIHNTLAAFAGGASEAVTRINLKRLGLTDEEIQTAIDEVLQGQIDATDVKAEEGVTV